MNPAEDVQLLLASASPRRAALLAQVGLPFEVEAADLDERLLPGEAPADYVLRLAVAKANAVARPQQITIAADTAVVSAGMILGKPLTALENLRMLEVLSGSRHEVYTGIAVQFGARSLSARVRAEVWFRELHSTELKAYVATGEGFDKAGGYAIQGVGSIFVTRVSGSYSAVVGLPLAELETMLVSLGIDTWRLRDHG